MDAAAWNQKYDEGVVWTNEPNAHFTTVVGGLMPGRALDLACGQGRNAVWLAQQGWTVTAVDFSASALAKGRALAAERGADVTWIEADLVHWEPPRAAYDLVAVLFLHLPAQLRAAVLAVAGEALVPGGTIVVMGHDARNATEGYGGPQDPSVLLDPQAIAGELEPLEIITAQTLRRPVPEPDANDALDTVVVARARGDVAS
jgi:SAM-dependent methyltransferase